MTINASSAMPAAAAPVHAAGHCYPERATRRTWASPTSSSSGSHSHQNPASSMIIAVQAAACGGNCWPSRQIEHVRRNRLHLAARSRPRGTGRPWMIAENPALLGPLIGLWSDLHISHRVGAPPSGKLLAWHWRCRHCGAPSRRHTGPGGPSGRLSQITTRPTIPSPHVTSRDGTVRPRCRVAVAPVSADAPGGAGRRCQASCWRSLECAHWRPSGTARRRPT